MLGGRLRANDIPLQPAEVARCRYELKHLSGFAELKSEPAMPIPAHMHRD
jgi:hypothetical protein